jgi:hypothetical protein
VSQKLLTCGCRTITLPSRCIEEPWNWPMDQLNPTGGGRTWYWWCNKHSRWVPELAPAGADTPLGTRDEAQRPLPRVSGATSSKQAAKATGEAPETDRERGV